ncbi:hypothetical protein [Bacteroides uniformis]|uniref:hypothetical protein n=1 Tax=Bacteroides uniformis TaxID=820 RepID=UPI00202FC82E|nr:hypothetical protein [Bacteroides uniformis]MCM1730914.1 hypothetical protein [Bacteroides uniformis]MCM1929476.1 hypothetical protein [Bacteroides uniformis]MCM1932984.1 hypothetical protein [Bacteroides uniformis]
MKGKTNAVVIISETETLLLGTEVEIVDIRYGCNTSYMCIIPSGKRIEIDARLVDISDYTPFTDWNKLRIELAGKAIQGFCSNPHEQVMNADSNVLAEWSIDFADALIKKLKGE